jgi:type II secretory pathway pseudopilin PulG
MWKIVVDRRGMTLAEIFVALGVIFVGLIALAAVAPLATSQVGEAQLKTTATFLAQQRIEQIKNSQWTENQDLMCAGNAACNTALGEVAPQWPDDAYGALVVGGTNYPRFRRTVRIATCSVVACGGIATDPSLSTLRQVTVTVSFLPLNTTGQFGANEESITVTSLISRRP